MMFLPLDSYLEKLHAGEVVGLVGPGGGPGLEDADAWRPGREVYSGRVELSLARGPGRLMLARAVAPCWTVMIPLSTGIDVELEGLPDVTTAERGDLIVFAPGAMPEAELSPGASCFLVTVPPIGAEYVMGTGGVRDVWAREARGGSWLIRRTALEPALGPRDKVKIVEGNLWRPQAPRGLWHPGTEILSEEFALGVFRTGSPESAHLHERSWELYYVVEGELMLNIRPHRLGVWESCCLGAGQCLILPPGAAHLVERGSDHLSTVVQVPPAISDRETVSFTPGAPSLKLPFYD